MRVLIGDRVVATDKISQPSPPKALPERWGGTRFLVDPRPPTNAYFYSRCWPGHWSGRSLSLEAAVSHTLIHPSGPWHVDADGCTWRDPR